MTDPLKPSGAGRTKLVLAAVTSALAIGGSFAYLAVQTRIYFVDVPFWDEWLLLPFIDLRAQGALTASALASPHNEHIPLFPRIILLWLAWLTNWNLWYECLANLALGVLTLVPLLLWIRRQPHTTPVQRQVLYACIAITIFSLNQWENWMWGWQVEVFLSTAALTWGILALTSTGVISGLLLGSLCGIVATLSFATGILFWPATLPLAWNKWRRRPVLLVCWLTIGVAVTTWYLNRVGWLASESGELRTTTPSAVLGTALRVLGSALVGYREKVVPANLVGAVGVLAAAGAAVKGFRERARSDAGAWRWWTLLAFALASMVLIAVGRRLPISRPVPSRYLTFANVYWVALAVLLVRAERRLIAVALLVPALTMMTALDARELYIHRKLTLVGGRAALYAPIDSPVLGRFFWSSDFVLSQLSTLRRLHLSVFDCSRQFSSGDWEKAAATIRQHSRPGDVVVASNDWGAACLTEHLRRFAAGVSIISAGESQAKTQAAIDGKQAAFLISGGDVGGVDARAWIERHGFPLYRSPIGSLRLLYYPDRVAFVRDRLGSDEIAADRTRFEGDGDLIAADDDRFFLWGWDHPQTDAQGRYRSILTHRVSLYVPVVRRSPAGLRMEFSDALLLAASRPDVAVTTVVNDVPAGSGTLARNRLTLHMDLSSASWRYGANIVRLELDNGGRVEPAVVEPLLIVRRVIFE